MLLWLPKVKKIVCPLAILMELSSIGITDLVTLTFNPWTSATFRYVIHLVVVSLCHCYQV